MSLLGSSRLLRSAMRIRIQPVVRIASKPAKDPLKPWEQFVGFTCLTMAIMGPSSWILAHLEDYKKREL